MAVINKIYPFMIRNKELDDSLSFLLKDTNGSILLIKGDSGTGKTFFSKEILYSVNKKYNNQVFTLYIDTLNDIHESSQIFKYMLQLVLLQSSATRDWPINIPKNSTYHYFKEMNNKKNILNYRFFNIISMALTYFGLGKLNNEFDKVNDSNFENELQKYLKWVSLKNSIVIVMDNIQFLNEGDRTLLESIFESIEENIKIVFIDRTINSISTIKHPLRVFQKDMKILEFTNCSEEETKEIVQKLIPNENKLNTISNDIFMKSKGIFKDIQYCIDSYLLEEKKGIKKHVIEGLLSTIDRLPLMHRQLLLIASLLSGGVKKKYVLNVIKRIYQIIEIDEINHTLNELVTKEYLKINSIRKDRVLPAHERIIKVMREIIDVETHEEVRASLIKEFKIILNNGNIEESETYILHCFIGLQNTQELIKNINYISRLIDVQFRQENFRYIVAFIEEMEELVYMLPEEKITLILDSFQKDSSFDKGLTLINNLYRNNIQLNKNNIEIFKFKFLIQSYHYQEALNVSKNIESSLWKDIYLINIYQALNQSKKAKELFETIYRKEINEEQAILRRNTITLLECNEAKNNLLEAKEYFEYSTGSEFRIATIENNLGITYLNSYNYGDALKQFQSALKKFQKVNSNEVYQAYINLGVYCILNSKLDEALNYFYEAKQNVPISLLLDRVKIDLNIYITKMLMDKISIKELNEFMIELNNKIKGIEMPYLRDVINKNLKMCIDKKTSPLIKNKNSIIVPIYTNGFTWHILMSIHWRY